jgi:hypothetical protein
MVVELYAELRTTFQDRERLLQEAEFQLRSLRGVYETMIEHTDTLMEQLDAYRGKTRHNSTIHHRAIIPLNSVHKKGSRSYGRLPIHTPTNLIGQKAWVVLSAAVVLSFPHEKGKKNFHLPSSLTGEWVSCRPPYLFPFLSR